VEDNGCIYQTEDMKRESPSFLTWMALRNMFDHLQIG
jgi:hypothetical protein